MRRATLHPLIALGYLWAVPVTVVGLLLALVHGPKACRWRDGALEFEVRRLFPGFVTGQTWGWAIMYRKPFESVSVRLAAHERVHVRQCLVLGPLVFLAYPIASLVAVLRGGHYYRQNWFERQAYGPKR